MKFRWVCPKNPPHARGVVQVSDNWSAPLLEAENPAQRKRLAAPPQVHCPHCGASAITVKVAA